MKNGTSPPRVIVTTAFATLFLWLLFIPVSCKKADRFETTGSTLQNKQEYQKGCFVFSLANLRKITCKYYVAATVNNALYEFDEYAVQDGILPPPNNLKILVHRYSEAGATPMFNVMKNTHPLEYATISGFFTATVGPFASLITGDLVTGSLIAGNIAHNAPDVAIGYHWNAVRFATDQIKEMAYHEFAHASHYRNTSFQLWVDNINFITHNGAYGDTDDPGVEKTDL